MRFGVPSLPELINIPKGKKGILNLFQKLRGIPYKLAVKFGSLECTFLIKYRTDYYSI